MRLLWFSTHRSADFAHSAGPLFWKKGLAGDLTRPGHCTHLQSPPSICCGKKFTYIHLSNTFHYSWWIGNVFFLLRFYFRLNVWAVQNRCICCFTQELFAVRFTADREQGWGLLSCQMVSRVWIVSFFECCTLDAVDFWQLQTVRQSSPRWRLQPSLTSRQQMGTTKLNTRPGSRWQRWWDIRSTATVPHDPYNAIQTSLTGHSFFSFCGVTANFVSFEATTSRVSEEQWPWCICWMNDMNDLNGIPTILDVMKWKMKPGECKMKTLCFSRVASNVLFWWEWARMECRSGWNEVLLR